MSKKHTKTNTALTFAAAVAFIGQGEDVNHLKDDIEQFMKDRKLPDEARDDIYNAVAVFRAAMIWGTDEKGNVNTLEDADQEDIGALLASLGVGPYSDEALDEEEAEDVLDQ